MNNWYRPIWRTLYPVRAFEELEAVPKSLPTVCDKEAGGSIPDSLGAARKVVVP
ncbi:Uncharacterised protein [Mycobacteroides abscessus subsp. massiliense]|nr:Uncharacterised protein [Mycobacteroides abscessus subsp. massiliense]SKR61943.1 Uncharacterised protein [Mycobacteroides abscessus subsp. massiliense]SKT68686.1 Uncharacterised protein [Mycobacteroides abscessus subsp. massiliense]SKT86869.1 Uncharacterised protein [Mycobacteroides abscessus subsp. massiliense]SLA00719.1 Uncharacterised protein [Mycobacteroides abscessus subsp. massiliense]